MMGAGSYCCASCVSPPTPISSVACPSGLLLPLLLLGRGIGVISRQGRRVSNILPVGWPCSSSSQCLEGYSYGEFRIGSVKKSGMLPSRPPGIQTARSVRPYEPPGGHTASYHATTYSEQAAACVKANSASWCKEPDSRPRSLRYGPGIVEKDARRSQRTPPASIRRSRDGLRDNDGRSLSSCWNTVIFTRS